jgi:hypothetical protein
VELVWVLVHEDLLKEAVPVFIDEVVKNVEDSSLELEGLIILELVVDRSVVVPVVEDDALEDTIDDEVRMLDDARRELVDNDDTPELVVVVRSVVEVHLVNDIVVEEEKLEDSDKEVEVEEIDVESSDENALELSDESIEEVEGIVAEAGVELDTDVTLLRNSVQLVLNLQVELVELAADDVELAFSKVELDNFENVVKL